MLREHAEADRAAWHAFLAKATTMGLRNALPLPSELIPNALNNRKAAPRAYLNAIKRTAMLGGRVPLQLKAR